MNSKTIPNHLANNNNNNSDTLEQNPTINNAFFNKYIFKKKICEGSIGKVYLSEKKCTNYPNQKNIVVIKVIEKKNSKIENKIRRDKEIPVKLDHSNIIKIIDFYEDNLKAYLVYPYYENSVCLAKIKRKRLNFENKENFKYIIKMLLQICTAIEYMHLKKVVHRDIKPENIIVSDSLALIIDFDLASIMDSIDYPIRSGIIGTPNYMAPEIWKEEENIDYFLADIYSLGVTFYFVFNMKNFPYDCNTIEELEYTIRYDNPIKSDSGMDLIDSLIMNMISKNPSKRPKIADIKNFIAKINSLV